MHSWCNWFGKKILRKKLSYSSSVNIYLYNTHTCTTLICLLLLVLPKLRDHASITTIWYNYTWRPMGHQWQKEFLYSISSLSYKTLSFNNVYQCLQQEATNRSSIYKASLIVMPHIWYLEDFSYTNICIRSYLINLQIIFLLATTTIIIPN